MSPLLRMLYYLNKPQAKPWNLIVTPNLTLLDSLVRRRDDELEAVWGMKLATRFNLDDYTEWNPNGISFTPSYNIPGSKVGTLDKDNKGQLEGTETVWVNIIGDKHRKNSKGQTITEILQDTLLEFPQYCWDNDRDVEMIVDHIEKRLLEVGATFEEVEMPADAMEELGISKLYE